MMTIPFDPDWTLAPAALLREWLDEHPGLDETLIADVCAFTPVGRAEALAVVREVLDRKPLGELHAAVLERATGIPARHWLNRERLYRDDLAAGRKDVTPE